jgi:hypothetical protein
MAAGASSTLSDEPCPGEEATSASGLAPVLRSMGPQGKGSRRSISPSEVKGGSRDQRERPRVEQRRRLGLGCGGASASAEPDEGF